MLYSNVWHLIYFGINPNAVTVTLTLNIVPNIKSAIKRVQIAERNRLRNKAYKSSVKTLMKKFFTAVEEQGANPSPEKAQEIQSLMSQAYSKIDKSVKKGVIHRNTAARRKARLAKVLKQIETPAASWTPPLLPCQFGVS